MKYISQSVVNIVFAFFLTYYFCRTWFDQKMCLSRKQYVLQYLITPVTPVVSLMSFQGCNPSFKFTWIISFAGTHNNENNIIFKSQNETLRIPLNKSTIFLGGGEKKSCMRVYTTISSTVGISSKVFLFLTYLMYILIL